MKTKLLDDNARRSIAQSKRRPAKIMLATVGPDEKSPSIAAAEKAMGGPIAPPAVSNGPVKVDEQPFEPVRLESMLRALSPTPSRVGEAGRPGVPSAAK